MKIECIARKLRVAFFLQGEISCNEAREASFQQKCNRFTQLVIAFDEDDLYQVT